MLELIGELAPVLKAPPFSLAIANGLTIFYTSPEFEVH